MPPVAHNQLKDGCWVKLVGVHDGKSCAVSRVRGTEKGNGLSERAHLYFGEIRDVIMPTWQLANTQIGRLITGAENIIDLFPRDLAVRHEESQRGARGHRHRMDTGRHMVTATQIATNSRQ